MGCHNRDLGVPFWLASGASYRVVLRVFGIPHSTVHWIVHQVTGLARQSFFKLLLLKAFLKAAINGCHVRAKLPSGPDGHCYKNRTLFDSIILQAVCDHQGRFVDTHWLAGVGRSSCKCWRCTTPLCLRYKEDELQDVMPEGEGENGLEAATSAPW